jgi:hypothetical protein
MENEVVAPDTPEAPAPEAPAVEVKAEPSRADTIREAMKQTEDKPPRLARAPREAKEAKATDPKFPTEKTEAPKMAEMPKSLRRELKEHWEKAPSELQQAIAQRDADYEKGIASYKSRDAEARQITEQFAPYEWILRNENTTPAAAIGPLLQTAALLRTGTPQQKSQAVAQMIQQFQIPLDQVASYFNGETPQPENTHYNQLAQQVQQLTQHITQSQYEAQKQNENRALSVIQQFAGDPANMHFEAVSDRMLQLLQAPQVLGDTSQMSEREKLQLAYDTAVRLDPAIAQQFYAQQQQNTQAANQVQRAKTAAVQVRGAPGSSISGAINQTDRRAVIANALRQIG